jgi:hypothetical protein
MDRLRANRAAAEQEGARRARHGSPDEGSDAAVSIPADDGSHATAGPAPRQPGLETGTGRRDHAAGSPNSRPPGAGAPRPPADTAQPAPPRPSGNPWTTGSWAGRGGGSRPVPATNVEPSRGGSGPTGETPDEVARNVAVPPTSMPNEAVRGSAAGGGMPSVGLGHASGTVTEAGSGAKTHGGATATDAVSGTGGSRVVGAGLDRASTTVPEAGSGDTADADAAARGPVPGAAGSDVVPPELAPADLRRASAPVPEAGSDGTARGGAAAQDLVPGVAGGAVISAESAPVELGRTSAAVPDGGPGDAVRGGAAAGDPASGVAGGDVAPPESAPAEIDRMSAAVFGAGPGDAGRGGAAAQDLVLGVAGGGVAAAESTPVEWDRLSTAVSEAESAGAVRGGAATRDLASGVAGRGVVPPESAAADPDRMSAAGSGDRAPGSAAARDLVRDTARTEEVPPASATAEWRRASTAVSEAGFGDTAAARDSGPGVAGSGVAPDGLDRVGAAVSEARAGETAHASAAASDLRPDAAASLDPAPAEVERAGAVASEARSEEATHSDVLPAAARGEVERGIATALDAALTEALSGTTALGNSPARGVKSGEPALNNVASEGPASAEPVPAAERLRGALEDVDRAWNLTFGEPTPPAAPVVEDCRIVIDVARDGRRFAGPRAAAVLRTIAGRLHLQLPAGARVGTEPHDGLVIEIPSTGYGSAARWMNRTLPGLLDGLTFDDDLARLHLRSVVYGADGPVGAQVLVRLDQTPLESPSSSSGHLARHAEIGDPEVVAGVGLPEPAVSTCGCPTEVAMPTEQARSALSGLPDPGHDPLAAGEGGLITGREAVPGSSEGAAAAGNRGSVADERERAVGNGAVLASGALSAMYGGPAVGEGTGSSTLGVGGPTARRDSSAGAAAGSGAPVAGRDGHDAVVEDRAGSGQRSFASPQPSARDEAAAPSGRHAATDRTPFRPSPSSHNPGHAGRRHRPDPETSARPVEVPDTDGLGLADLLAGALAAYRGI